MLSEEQVAHFHTFGFLVLQEAFDAREMEKITTAANALWAEELARSSGATGVGMAPFIELSPALAWLAEDDRIYNAMGALLGPGFIWSGSEGNYAIDPDPTHDWHADRPGRFELDYLRIKIMLYLSPMKKEEGALRLIPCSHRDPLHTELKPFQDAHGQKNPSFFGLSGADVPCHALETVPGDAAVFSQSLFHGVYGKVPDRRYIALKYAARPTTDAHLASLYKFSSYAFEAHGLFRESQSPRLRPMVDDVVAQREKAVRMVAKIFPT